MRKKVLFVLVLFFVIFVFSIPFLIKVRFDCESQFGRCSDDIVQNLNSLNGKSLFIAKRKANSFLKNNLLIFDFSIHFNLPNLLKVNLILKKPSFALKDPSSNTFYLIDKDGMIIALTQSAALPTVISLSDFKKVGEKVDENILFALNIISGVNDIYQINVGKIENDSLLVDMASGIRVIFPLEGDYKVLLGSLRLIYTKITTDYSGIYSQIDMRYKNPVLR